MKKRKQLSSVPAVRVRQIVDCLKGNRAKTGKVLSWFVENYTGSVGRGAVAAGIAKAMQDVMAQPEGDDRYWRVLFLEAMRLNPMFTGASLLADAFDVEEVRCEDL